MNPNQNPQWQYNPSGTAPAEAAPAAPHDAPAQSPPPTGTVSWTAAEFIEHERGTGWYLGLVVATVVISAVTYFVTKDFFATGTMVVLGLIVGFAAGHKPRQLEYEVSQSGLQIGAKTYPYNQFKSFSVIQEGELSSINLVPIKRFMPMISAYFAPSDQERIANSLGNYLPYQPRQMDRVDRLSRRLRF